jgi:predicted small lipoprotein YifL
MRHDNRRRAVRGLFVAALASLVVVLAGCGKKGWLETYPVKGTVLVDGKPAAGATVSFHTKEAMGDKPYIPTGRTDENGEFNLSTFVTDDGAPAGEYDVTVVWHVRYNPISTLWEGDKLHGQYANKAKSTLRANVEKHPQQLSPFELTGSPPKK